MDVAGFAPAIGFYLDAVSVVWVLVITVVGFLIHLYSTEHMEHDEGYTPVLHVPEPVRRLHAHPGAGRQPAAAVPGLGGRGPLQLPADRFWYKDPQNVYSGRKAFIVTRVGDTAHDRRPVPAVHAARHAADPAAAARGGDAVGAELRRGHRRRPAAAGRRRRQVGAGAAADVAPRRHGRPEPRQRAHPRRHHGHRRRVPHRAHQRALRDRRRRPARGRHRRHRHRCSSPASARSCSTTSSASWPTPPSARSATCSWRSAWPAGRRACSTS